MSRVPSAFAFAFLICAACHRTTPAAEGAEAGAPPVSPMADLLLGDAGDGRGLGLGGLAGVGQLGHGLERAPEPLVIPTGSAPPMPTGASSAEREKELVGLLTGHVGPGSLPVVPTDPNRRFDEGLRDRLTSTTRFEGSVKVMKIDVEGPLPKNEVARIVAGARARMRACYINAINRNPDLEGELRVRMEIVPAGDVKAVTFKAGATPAGSEAVAGDAALTACVVGVSRRLFFPTSDAGTSVITYEATFTLDGAAALP